MLTVKVLGLEEFQRDWERFGRELIASSVPVVENAGKAGLRAAAPLIKGKTGKLAKSARSRLVKSTRYEILRDMYWGESYASFVDKGTKAHIIWPREGHGPLKPGQKKRKKTDIGTARVALRWGHEGDWRFAKYFPHQGSKAVHFTKAAMEAAFEELMHGFGPAFERATHHLLAKGAKVTS